MQHTKQSLRKFYLQKRAALNEEQRLRGCHHILDRMMKFPGLTKQSVVAGYFPIHDEVNVLPIMAVLHAKGNLTALPVIRHTKNPLSFHIWRPGDRLVACPFFKALHEPPSITSVVIPDIIMVPLLAFNRQGYRLGYGSGMYDSTIANLRQQGQKTITVGMAYSVQEAHDLPHDSFDQKVDYIITDKEMITAGTGE